MFLSVFDPAVVWDSSSVSLVKVDFVGFAVGNFRDSKDMIIFYIEYSILKTVSG